VILKIEFFLETQKKEYKKGRSQIPENLGWITDRKYNAGKQEALIIEPFHNKTEHTDGTL
jgi:hypothetical protein